MSSDVAAARVKPLDAAIVILLPTCERWAIVKALPWSGCSPCHGILIDCNRFEVRPSFCNEGIELVDER